MRGVIPIGRPVLGRTEVCNTDEDPGCGSIAFGKELLLHPHVRVKIDDWLAHFCQRIPVTFTETYTLYDSAEHRRREIADLKKFMGCESPITEARNLHIWIVNDFDDVFNRSGPEFREAFKKAVVERYVIRLGQ